ncbi:FlgN protein [Thermoanaerobacter thermohydrosulfuricus]|uniref:flagellar export chaperone FlgN n=1 Tax=Thermoanaerobacter indiensis TaxID=1125974 RepID=UPI00036A392F|nr:flagellar export chaperone FlgN [Thermoanaerobacter indiensis]SFE74476.1 FlgN protein [Thermoanaerobacter thermohydrosulfuricus]
MRKVDGMNNVVEKLTQLVQDKIQKLKELCEVTEKIGIAIASNNLEELKNLLITKQQIIEEINELDTDFIPLYNNFKKENKVESIFALENKITGEISKLKALFREAKALLEKIKEKDDKNLKEITDVFERTGNKLEELSKNKEGYIEYLKYYTPDSYFLDKKR